MTMVGFPLLLIPLAIYNIIVFLMPGVSLAEPVVRLTLMSGAEWPLTLSDMLLALGIVVLLLEVIKGARPGAKYLIQSASKGSHASTRGKRRARPNKGGCAMLGGSIKSPCCPKCGETMSLRIIEPERPGFDSQTFECPKCHDTEALVTPISSGLDVSVAAPTSTAIPQPRWRS